MPSSAWPPTQPRAPLSPYTTRFRSQELQELAQNLVDAESPNPPGDVRLPLEVAAKYFDKHEIPYARVSIDRENKKVNLVARVIGAHEGPHQIGRAHV